MTVPWSSVAGPGTDPDLLARVVALSATPQGRLALRDPGPRPRDASPADPTGRSGVTAGAAAGGPVGGHPDLVAEGARAAAAAAARWAAGDVRVVLPGDPTWPAGLDRLPSPPSFLAVRGAVPDADRPAVAIVGARRATGYGTGVAAWLAQAVGDAGAVVVSGGARGIDAAAHGAAAGTGSVVVLGCGHDVAYPRQHARPGGLFDDVIEGGGALVSEQLPTVAAHPGVVRARNRLVAALADVVVVVEGGPRSGALLTATAAAELGVELLAVPGDVRAPGSVAPHRLLREGAAPCAGPDDLLAALAAVRPLAVSPSSAASDAVPGGTTAPSPSATVLPPAVRDELVRRWPRPVSVGVLAEVAGVSVGAVLAAVTRGVVAGELAESAEGVRLRRSPPT